MRFIGASGIVLWLTILWVLLWGNLSAANVLGGIAVAIGVLLFSRLPRLFYRRSVDAALINPVATLWFGVYVLYKLVEANLLLAWEIVTPRNKINTGVVAVPLRTDSEAAMLVVANVITLTPGTITFEARHTEEATDTPPVLFVNVLHLHDLERVRRDLLHIEVLSVRAFGSRAARDQLTERMPA